MTHRREIDGLRAVAVLPVILFHAGFGWTPGGFAGVDVFFVISGYLITGLLLDDLRAGRFDLLHFYERRARRILPALVVVILCVTPVAWLVMLPAQFADYGTSLAATALFVSNLYFLTETGYFAPAAELQPLLHTWSLAVEEQYYLLFPPLLALAWRGGARRTAIWLCGLAAASFLFALWATAENPARSFFFTAGRIWELLAGGLCAVAERHRLPPARDVPAAAGLAMILGAVLLIDAEMPVPGTASLLPVAGTALVLLWGREGTATAGLLALRAPVAVGLVSYSAYLWHQPILALLRLSDAGLSPAETVPAVTAASLLLAWLTWAWIEQPFRRRSPPPRLPGRRAALSAAGGALAAVAVAGLGIRLTDGLEGAWRRLHPQSATLLDAIERAATEADVAPSGDCRFRAPDLDPAALARLRECGARHGPGVLVLGDSHAVDIFGMVVSRPSAPPFVVGAVRGGCRPDTPARDCPYEPVAALAAAEPDLFAVILYSQSGLHLLERGPGATGLQSRLSDLPETAALPRVAMDDLAVAATLSLLSRLARDVPAVWLGPRIEPLLRPERLVRRGCTGGRSLRPGTEALFRELDRSLSAAASAAGIPYLSQIELLDLRFPRDFGPCLSPWWSDEDHYSAEGERILGARTDIVARALAASGR